MLVGVDLFAKYCEGIPALPTTPFFTMSALPDYGQARNTPTWFATLVNRSERRGGPQRQATLNDWFQRANAAGIEARLLAGRENQHNTTSSQPDVIMSPPAPPLDTASTSQAYISYVRLSNHILIRVITSGDSSRARRSPCPCRLCDSRRPNGIWQ